MSQAIAVTGRHGMRYQLATDSILDWRETDDERLIFVVMNIIQPRGSIPSRKPQEILVISTMKDMDAAYAAAMTCPLEASP